MSDEKSTDLSEHTQLLTADTFDRVDLELLHLQVLGMQAQLSAVERALAHMLRVPGREQIRRAAGDALSDATLQEDGKRTTPPRAVSEASRRLLDSMRTPEEQHANTFMHRQRERVDVEQRTVLPDAGASAPTGGGVPAS